MTVNKSIIIILVILLITQIVTSEEESVGDFEEGSSTTADQESVRQATETIDNSLKSGGDANVPSTPGTIQSQSPLGNINIPSQTSVQITRGNFYAKKIDSANTKNGEVLSSCREVYIFNKETQTENCKHFQKGPVSISNARNIISIENTLTISTGQHLQLRIPNSNDFWNIPNATDITIIFVGNNIQNVRMTLPDASIIVPNPLRLDTGTFQTIGDLNDADADGLSDSFEQINQLNSQNKDSDGDGLTDYEEVMLYPTNAKNTKQSL